MSDNCTCHDLLCHAPWCPAGIKEDEQRRNEQQIKEHTICKTLCESYAASSTHFDEWWEETGKNLYRVLL